MLYLFPPPKNYSGGFLALETKQGDNNVHNTGSQSDLYSYANSRTRYLQMGVPLVEKKEMIKFLNRDKSSTQCSE